MTKARLLASTTIASDSLLPVPAEASESLSISAATDEQFLPTSGASDYLRTRWGVRRSPRTLQQMRRGGDGPRYRKSGNDVLYTKPGLDAWVLALFAAEFGSTAEESEYRRLTTTEEKS